MDSSLGKRVLAATRRALGQPALPGTRVRFDSRGAAQGTQLPRWRSRRLLCAGASLSEVIVAPPRRLTLPL